MARSMSRTQPGDWVPVGVGPSQFGRRRPERTGYLGSSSHMGYVSGGVQRRRFLFLCQKRRSEVLHLKKTTAFGDP